MVKGKSQNFVKDLAKPYRLPIWLTEFKGWSGPRDEHGDFLKKALKFLERVRSVERYAYFEPGKGGEHSLLYKDGSLTKMGEMYCDAGISCFDDDHCFFVRRERKATETTKSAARVAAMLAPACWPN